MKKLLTIGIPNYNGGSYLEKTILSCQNIDLHPHEYEILVIDNASTDDSVHRVSVLQKQFPQLRLVINEKNYGRIGNWNRILELADSDFLLFEMIGDEINSVSLRDDLIQMKQEKAFIRYGAQDIAGNHNRFFKKFSDSGYTSLDIFIAFPADMCKDSQFFYYLGCTIFDMSIIRREQLQFDESMGYYADTKFEYEYLKHISRGRYSSQCLFRFHTERQRFSSQDFFNMFEDIIALFAFQKNQYHQQYNHTKLLFILTAWAYALYVKSLFTKHPISLREIKNFLGKQNISWTVSLCAVFLAPWIGIAIVFNDRWKTLHIPIFTVYPKK